MNFRKALERSSCLGPFYGGFTIEDEHGNTISAEVSEDQEVEGYVDVTLKYHDEHTDSEMSVHLGVERWSFEIEKGGKTTHFSMCPDHARLFFKNALRIHKNPIKTF